MISRSGETCDTTFSVLPISAMLASSRILLFVNSTARTLPFYVATETGGIGSDMPVFRWLGAQFPLQSTAAAREGLTRFHCVRPTARVRVGRASRIGPEGPKKPV